MPINNCSIVIYLTIACPNFFSCSVDSKGVVFNGINAFITPRFDRYTEDMNRVIDRQVVVSITIILDLNVSRSLFLGANHSFSE